MKSSDFIGMAKMYLPYLKIEGKGTHVYKINDHWEQHIIYWTANETRNGKPFLEIRLSHSIDGFSKKSNKKFWNIFCEKYDDNGEWIMHKPYRSWY